MLSLLKKYRVFVIAMLIITLAQQAANLWIPRIIAQGIDDYASGSFLAMQTAVTYAGFAIVVLVLGIAVMVLEALVAERVARDLRARLTEKISRQNFLFVQRKTSSVLLTNFLSDIDAIKQFVAQGVVTSVSSIIIIFGAAFMLLHINWRLGLAVLVMVPLIAVAMITLFSRVRPLFTKGQEVVDRLNTVINESILGASLIRVLHAQSVEYQRFLKTNADAKDIGMQILRTFAALIPIITIIANGASIIMVMLGGKYIVQGTLSVGEFAAFMSYLGILIFPIFILGFMSNVIGRAVASYARIEGVLNAPEEKEGGEQLDVCKGNIEIKNVTLTYAEKKILDNISFSIQPHTRTAIIGPTAAGKTQLLYLLSGLTQQTTGEILFDQKPILSYDQTQLRSHLGIVFQDSVLFNLSLKDNIAFGGELAEEKLWRAIETAELVEFVQTLPGGLDTVVSERGTSLSGGQKQRVMLARALAHEPDVLFLDDFTARVDARTEASILENIAKNYPNITLISVTQKIGAVQQYDQIIVLMEGEILAMGTHEKLIHECPEYAQIVESQRSTNTYELQSQ